ncbi:putative mannose-6-phosphate isomerase [Helianthus annuus]|uniref:mannose-6-phosphate isomerase n=1 Tax=Helianthus annuus TaxID=4232 RepID=A0A251T3D9_HELAN|nr:mannose-6-phosphate isomerase 1 [Helianthus annuus]KAF5778711.1 putative mannose-6-phosphate isomerase [Helianthus annuus]KAJ0490073.1 putative mannose-6-phosphate isomerase [Helianthus annuus]KAJ0494162.1 putative mannose-6-phosphate isomerase [Helianthus annuus]KAJ0505985.1 putative mannose-6-phosphate isomerase [Helianthus annuus]KAJ0675656.1 putative mannose-6-phosphate isomerase [Helianthus annuus]
MEEITNGGNKNEPQLLKLKCSVQNYDWGRIGYDSRVATLFEKNCGVQIDEKKHYAEFWMGTHVSGPSVVDAGDGDNVSLKVWIVQNPKVLGDVVVDKWGVDLPFLLKVLSVGKSLSIQAHPDQELAGFLHKTQPNVYKDANHKPEMALALTEFEALCGFISSEELDVVLETVPEINEVVGNASANQILTVDKHIGELKEERALQSIFTKLMSVDQEVISEALSKLVNRLTHEKEKRRLTSKEELVLKLEKEYPNDVGVLAALLFNHVKLEPGDGLYIAANEPHAYLNGECIECMAASDNVVRAGLTPKYIDVKTLCSMLTYKQGLPEILKGVPMNQYVRRYTPPFEEFEVDQCVLDQGASVVFPALPGPSVFVVISGEGTMATASREDRVSEGDALFAPAGTEVHVSTDTELQLYRAGVNHKVLLNP